MDYIIYCILIISPIIQNFFLEDFIGKIGASPVPVILLCTLTYFFICKKKFKITSTNKILKKLLIYLFCINILASFYYLVLCDGNLIVLNENIILKAIKGYMYFVFVYLYVLVLTSLMDKITLKKAFKPIIICSVVLLFTFVFEKNFNELFTNLFHNGVSYNRIRLLTAESSFTSMMIIIYPMLSIYYYLYINNNKTLAFLMSLIFIVLFTNSDSKSLLINIPIAVFIYIIIKVNLYLKNKSKNINIKKIFIALCSMILIIFVYIQISEKLLISLKNDIENYTSIITRFYTIFVSILIGIKYPFGTGNALYMNILPNELMNNIFMISESQFNLSEIYLLMNSTTDNNVAIKSGIGQYMIYWGIVGTILFCIYLIKNIQKIIKNKRKGDNFILFLTVFIIVGIFNFIYFDTNYEFFILLIIVERIYKKNKNFREVFYENEKS